MNQFLISKLKNMTKCKANCYYTCTNGMLNKFNNLILSSQFDIVYFKFKQVCFNDYRYIRCVWLDSLSFQCWCTCQPRFKYHFYVHDY